MRFPIYIKAYHLSESEPLPEKFAGMSSEAYMASDACQGKVVTPDMVERGVYFGKSSYICEEKCSLVSQD